MSKVFSSTAACLLLVFSLIPVLKAGSRASIDSDTYRFTENNSAETSAERVSNLLFDSLQLGELGMQREAIRFAYKGQQKLVKQGKVSNPNILTVCDFSQPSDKKRFYIIDVRNFKVLLNTYVAHGKNSGLNYATKFSNRTSSHQSSLGFYVTKNTYFGKHGLSLKLSGQDKGFNDKAEARAIVVHGATYIGEEWLGSSYMGRSFGCPAVPKKYSNTVINLIKNGTCLFVYHPSKSYLHGSRLLKS